MKIQTLLALWIASVSSAFAAGDAHEITLTTFNVRFYGQGGFAQPANEHRNVFLKDFIARMIPKSDLYVFQEIVDVEGFQKNVLPENVKCISYVNTTLSHQHVMLCHNEKFDFKTDETDPDSVIEQVAIDSTHSRPALHTIVTDLSGNELFRLIGVHLKSSPESARIRSFQIDQVAKFLVNTPKKLPVVLGGDFNSFPEYANYENQSDVAIFQQIFNRSGVGLIEGKNPAASTFRNRNQKSKFDRFWFSSSQFTQLEPMQVFTVCNRDVIPAPNNYYWEEFYYKNVSDHCPVTLKLKLNSSAL